MSGQDIEYKGPRLNMNKIVSVDRWLRLAFTTSSPMLVLYHPTPPNLCRMTRLHFRQANETHGHLHWDGTKQSKRAGLSSICMYHHSHRSDHHDNISFSPKVLCSAHKSLSQQHIRPPRPLPALFHLRCPGAELNCSLLLRCYSL